MATRSFALNTEPHRAEIGDAVLLFEPEVAGDVFLDAYATIRDAQKAISGVENPEPEQIRNVTAALREFLASFMLPESQPVFAELRLPDRILTELLNWIMEIYGAGAGGENGPRPTGRSSASATPRRTPTTR